MFVGVSVGQTLPLIRSNSISIANGQVSIVVTDHGSGSTGYRLESSGTLVGTWDPITATPAISGNQITFTVTKPSATKLFYRVVGTAATGTPTPGDADGDGLPDSVEGKDNYSEVLIFDTDMDGFSDGVEYANGTDPRIPSDFPKLANLPAIEFVSSTESFVEGSKTRYTVSLKSSGSFSGSVAYRVNARSTVPASDYSFSGGSGTASFSGSSASFDVTFVDDFEIKPTRILYLELSPVTFSAGYRVGGASTHIVSLCENDSYWSGVLKDHLLSRDVRLRILRKTGQASRISFVAGNSDGLTDIAGGQSSQSTGIVPSVPMDVWDATGVQDSSTAFSATSPSMPVAVSTLTRFDGSTVKITEEALTRRITITADPGLDGQLIQREVFAGVTLAHSSAFVGRFSETIAPADATKVYLNRSREGIALFIKDLISPPDIEVVTIPTP